ncbi:hypothetical protein K7X08_002730 [Anisodus acutangulus]|uniref:Uncharacterized protein n=1 Tax=Anisodus acutangulus TaxID=402998 RepID=A0A9Q1MCA9_9SOLA|nr:hypothetical protein K7X08_002730 [Anisodus acutangulus]
MVKTHRMMRSVRAKDDLNTTDNSSKNLEKVNQELENPEIVNTIESVEKDHPENGTSVNNSNGDKTNVATDDEGKIEQEDEKFNDSDESDNEREESDGGADHKDDGGKEGEEFYVACEDDVGADVGIVAGKNKGVVNVTAIGKSGLVTPNQACVDIPTFVIDSGGERRRWSEELEEDGDENDDIVASIASMFDTVLDDAAAEHVEEIENAKEVGDACLNNVHHDPKVYTQIQR